VHIYMYIAKGDAGKSLGTYVKAAHVSAVHACVIFICWQAQRVERPPNATNIGHSIVCHCHSVRPGLLPVLHWRRQSGRRLCRRRQLGAVWTAKPAATHPWNRMQCIDWYRHHSLLDAVPTQRRVNSLSAPSRHTHAP
jgi:hypothetical protein